MTRSHRGVKTSLRCFAASAALGGLVASQAVAQEAPATAGDPAEADIVITAQKREQRLQDVPASIAVLSGEDLERSGAHGMEDYLRSIPGVSQVDNGPSSNGIVIRGISTGPEYENFNAAATVATYFGETSVTGVAGQLGGGGVDIRPVDLERVEVLRGPQGTTIGDAALGGVVRLIPARPDLDTLSVRALGAYSRTGRFGGDNTMIQGTLNLPVVRDMLAVRAVGYRYSDSGFYRNIAGVDPATVAKATGPGLDGYRAEFEGEIEEDVGRIRTLGGRVQLLFEPSDSFNLTAGFLTQRVEQDGWPRATLGDYLQSDLPLASNVRRRGRIGAFADNEIHLYNLVGNYDFGPALLTSVVSWTEGNAANSVDSYADWGFPNSNTSISRLRQFATETRIVSQFSIPLELLAGVYYQNVRETGTQVLDYPGAPSPTPIGSSPVLSAEANRFLEQYAVFGEASYTLFDRLTATIGARYFDYRKRDQLILEGSLFGVPVGTGTAPFQETRNDGTSLRASVAYAFDRDNMVYASWAQGFRLGRATAGLAAFSTQCDADGDGFLDGTDVTIDSTRTVRPDSLDTYEAGARLALFDRRVRVSAAAYHTRWRDLPVAVAAQCGASVFSYTANAAAAKSDGMELQATFDAGSGFTLDAGFGYVNARLAEDSPGLGASRGDRLPGAPKFNANLGAQYEFEVGRHQAFVRLDGLYAGDFYRGFAAIPYLRSGDYIKIDARAGITIRNVGVELFVQNLTNEDAYTWRWFDTNASLPRAGYQMRPRTIGIQLNFLFQ